MARTKRMNTNPDAPTRSGVRRRITDDNRLEAITGDLNRTPQVSGDAPVVSSAPVVLTTPVVSATPVVSNIPDAGSSRQDSPKDISSSRVLDSGPTLFDDQTTEDDEDMRQLREEYQNKVSEIKKRKEEIERKRKEEEEQRQREEMERVRQQEEQRKMEEARVRAAEILEETRKRAETEEFLKEEELRRRVEETYQDQYSKLGDGMNQDTSQEENPMLRAMGKKGVVTRSKVAMARKTPATKPKKRVSRKGKTTETSLSSSSMDIDVSDSQIPIQNPHQSTVGTEHALSGVPRQFTTQAVAAHFESIASQKLKLERGFDPDFVASNPFVKDKIAAQDWSILAAANRRANASLVREFYAEASQSKNPTVRIRGKQVSFSPEEINRVLGRGNRGVCELSQFLETMTPAVEDRILREIAIEGKPWDRDGQRRCLKANSLTTEAAVWFQFVRASLSPTSHDTTLSMRKCALVYCILMEKKIDVGIVMHAAIDQARTRKKVVLPLPCLITLLMIEAGVPSALEDVWFDSTSNISVATIRKMKRQITTPPSEPEEIPTVGTVNPTVGIAEEHVIRTPRAPLRSADAGGSANQMSDILANLKKINYRLELLEGEQRYQNRATNSFWMYSRERDEVMGQFMKEVHPVLAAQLPAFPADICATYASDDSLEEDSGDSSPTATPTH